MRITVNFDPEFANRIEAVSSRANEAMRQALKESAREIGAKGMEHLSECSAAYHASEGAGALLTIWFGPSPTISHPWRKPAPIGRR